MIPSILYGVQAAGNGPVSRARLMAEAFRRLEVPVDFVFSGRAASTFFDMDEFPDARYRTGLSLVAQNGRISPHKSLTGNNPVRYLTEVSRLRTERYDLVISDGEPTVSWAARLRNTPTLAIGHRCALDKPAPQPQGEQFSGWVQRKLMPADTSVGFHWYPYSQSVLPPMVDTSLSAVHAVQGFTLVYLPADQLEQTISMFQHVKDEYFVVYSPQIKTTTQLHNVSLYPLSKTGFYHHLTRCRRLVCNTGFQLMSEAMHLGIPVLAKPVQGDFEQSANALALKELGLAEVQRNFSVLGLDRFVHTSSRRSSCPFPDVASALVRYCISSATANASSETNEIDLSELSEQLWAQVNGGAGFGLRNASNANRLEACST